MSQVIEDFELMCRVGYGCGLQTISESYDQITRHYDVFFKIEEAASRLENLYFYIESQGDWGDTIKGVKGSAWCGSRDLEEKLFVFRGLNDD